MKQRFLFAVPISICVAIILVVSGGCAKPSEMPGEMPTEEETSIPSQPEQQVFKWRLQSVHAPAEDDMTHATLEYVNRIRDCSNGRLDITLYAAGELVPTMDIAVALSERTIEMAWTTGGFYAGAIPEGNLAGCGVPPLIYRSLDEVLYLYWELGLDELMREGWAEHGVYYLMTNPCGVGGFWSNDPVYHPEDLKGVKIRGFGQVLNTFEKLGASPVFIPPDEIYMALSTGVIDAAVSDYIKYDSMKCYEISKYIYYPPWLNPAVMDILVSMDAWNELPDDLKAIVKTASVAYALDHTTQCLWTQREMESHYDEWGTTAITWSEEDMQKVVEVAWSLAPELAATSPRCAEGYRIIEDFMRERGYL